MWHLSFLNNRSWNSKSGLNAKKIKYWGCWGSSRFTNRPDFCHYIQKVWLSSSRIKNTKKHESRFKFIHLSNFISEMRGSPNKLWICFWNFQYWKTNHIEINSVAHSIYSIPSKIQYLWKVTFKIIQNCILYLRLAISMFLFLSLAYFIKQNVPGEFYLRYIQVDMKLNAMVRKLEIQLRKLQSLRDSEEIKGKLY